VFDSSQERNTKHVWKSIDERQVSVEGIPKKNMSKKRAGYRYRCPGSLSKAIKKQSFQGVFTLWCPSSAMSDCSEAMLESLKPMPLD
jgi:hypothetical protein